MNRENRSSYSRRTSCFADLGNIDDRGKPADHFVLLVPLGLVTNTHPSRSGRRVRYFGLKLDRFAAKNCPDVRLDDRKSPLAHNIEDSPADHFIRRHPEEGRSGQIDEFVFEIARAPHEYERRRVRDRSQFGFFCPQSCLDLAAARDVAGDL
jgi:hypothetical protein